MKTEELVELIRRTPQFVDWISDEDDSCRWPIVVCEVCGNKGQLGYVTHKEDCLREKFNKEYGEKSL